METKERMLHFDVSLGCTAEALVGALADLNGDIECVKVGLEACGISDVDAVLRHERSKTASGTVVELPLFTQFGAGHIPAPTRGTKRRPFWARTRAKPLATNASEHEVQTQSWLKGESVTLTEIRSVIESCELNPVSQALALKAIKELTSALERSSDAPADATLFSGEEGTRMLCHIVAFSQLFSSINPSGVTASRVAMSFGDHDAHHRGWLYALSEDLPVIERNWPAPYSDCVGIALLKSVASRFGARGESIIERQGVGINAGNAEPRVVARALLCLLTGIASRTSSTSGTSEAFVQVEITAILGHGVDIADLMRRLHGFGMRSVYTWQVFEASTFPRMMLRGVLSHAEAETAVEAILVTGEAIELSTQVIESQKLHQRTVSVPFGRGQKMQACRVNEWLWSGKVLRADPDPSDLAVLVQATGFAQDVLRADVLAAWRKFRQKS